MSDKMLKFVNVKKKPNFETLSTTQRLSLNTQLYKMIEAKYDFFKYNG